MGVVKAAHRGRAFQTTPYLVWMGIFVWADALIIGPFWVFTSLISIILNDGILFCLIASVFWIVRAMGEVVYWIQEQFASKHRNTPQSLWGESLFRGELIWVIYQLMWQCISVAAIILAIYFGYMWLTTDKLI
jgi:hypothetical protein